MGADGKKKICHIRFNASDTPARAFQDCGMFLYTLAKDFNGSIINVGVTPLRCHFQHYFFAKK